MTEIMPELLDEITDESIMAEVSDKLNIGSYDGDGYESGESGYDSPRTESRDFITMTDVDDNHHAAEHNVDLFFSQSGSTNIEYHFLEEIKSVPGELVPSGPSLGPLKPSAEQPSTGTESEIDSIDESAEDNWKNISSEEIEKLVEYLKENAPIPMVSADTLPIPPEKVNYDTPPKTDSDIEKKSDARDWSKEIHQSELGENENYEMDISDSASEEVLFEVLYKNTTPDHHKYKPLLLECDKEDGRACHDELCTSTCTNKKCKLQCHQVVRCWRRREQNKRNSTGFQKRNNLHMKDLQKQKKQIKIDLEKNKKLNVQLKDEIRLLKLKLAEIEKSKSVLKA